MLNTSQVDYSVDFYKKQKDESSIKELKEQYNPYVNNSGTVMGKKQIYIDTLLI